MTNTNKKNTLVINLFGGPGCGKSTTAALLFAMLKQNMEDVELVREYVKNWAWRGHAIEEWDQVYLFAKQLRAESALYGKVDYIVTDSPLALCKVYEERYCPGVTTTSDLCDSILERQRSAGIRHLNVLLRRSKPYVAKGRYENEEQARELDAACGRLIPELWVADNAQQILDIIRTLSS